MRVPEDVTVAGVPVRSTSMDEAVEEFITRATERRGGSHRFVNAYTLALADTDGAYQLLLSSTGINLPDGKPLVAVLNVLNRGGRRYRQVRGPSFFEACMDRGRDRGLRHYLLGGAPEVLDTLLVSLRDRHPGVQIVGAHSPPFGPMTEADRWRQDLRIRACNPHVVWVGLGTPKQDYEAQRLADDLRLTTAGVGAAFDFSAGVKPVAPDFLRRMSLEWAFRLATEPRRLWKRYVFGNSRFLLMVLRALIGR